VRGLNIKVIDGFLSLECVKANAYGSAALRDNYALFAPKTAFFALFGEKCAHMSRDCVLSLYLAA
jgi:hypothetical protein